MRLTVDVKDLTVSGSKPPKISRHNDLFLSKSLIIKGTPNMNPLFSPLNDKTMTNDKLLMSNTIDHRRQKSERDSDAIAP